VFKGSNATTNPVIELQFTIYHRGIGQASIQIFARHQSAVGKERQIARFAIATRPKVEKHCPAGRRQRVSGFPPNVEKGLEVNNGENAPVTGRWS
jgi:hypothetical protein